MKNFNKASYAANSLEISSGAAVLSGQQFTAKPILYSGNIFKTIKAIGYAMIGLNWS